MKIRVPNPTSGGLILSYKCSAKCRHCIYGCSPHSRGDWISEEDLEKILSQLSGKIIPNPYGPTSTSLNHGLHFTGGEPFLNFDVLCGAVEIAHRYRIPSMFVETNCFWAVNDKITSEKLKLLKSKGLHGIMISVNPFYLEYVPFERTDRTIRIAIEVFDENVMVYQLEYYRRFKIWGLRDRVTFEDYELKDVYPRFHADFFFHDSCMPSFLRNLHNHFDNYGNYIPGFCGGISDIRKK
jgi:hypothetical protein